MGDEGKLYDANLPKVSQSINGRRYTITRLGWWGVQELLADLNVILGPSLVDLLDGEELSVETLLETSGGKVGSALTGALGRIVAARGLEVQRRLGGQTVVEDVKGSERRNVLLSSEVMDVWFAKHPEDALPWLWFALEAQLRAFFERPIAAITTTLRSRNVAGSPLSLAEKGPVEEPRSPST